MRSCTRSAIACTRSPVVSATRSRNVSVGPAAYGSERAPRQSKTSSGAGTRAHPLEEGGDVGMGLRATVEPGPVHPQQPDEFVAGVDRNDVVLVRLAVAAHEQGLDVVVHVADDRRGLGD